MPREVQSLYTDANNVVARGGEREGDRVVMGPDRADHEADSWAWLHSAAHPDAVSAIAAIQGGPRALPRERLAVSLLSLDALRHGSVARADLEVVDDTVDELSLVTLARARASLDPTLFEVGVLASDPPRPAPSGLRRGNSYATEGVRGPRPPERRPGS